MIYIQSDTFQIDEVVDHLLRSLATLTKCDVFDNHAVNSRRVRSILNLSFLALKYFATLNLYASTHAYAGQQ